MPSFDGSEQKQLLLSILVHLSPFRQLYQSTIVLIAYKQQKFLAHSPGHWKSKVKAPAWSGPLPLIANPFLLCLIW